MFSIQYGWRAGHVSCRYGSGNGVFWGHLGGRPNLFLEDQGSDTYIEVQCRGRITGQYGGLN